MKNRNWLNVELESQEAKRFRGYLLDMHIQYESSGAGSLTHFECLMDETEAEKANEFLATL